MGRPKLKEKDKKVSVCVTLDPDQITLLRKLGGGNVSEGIRKLAALIYRTENDVLLNS